MESLKEACLKKPFKSFSDIIPGEYIVRNIALVTSRYGLRVRIDFDTFYMYLPERFNITLNATRCEELSKSPKLMIYSGKDTADKNRLLLDFQEVALCTKTTLEGLISAGATITEVKQLPQDH